jgi:hypothetical protein
MLQRGGVSLYRRSITTIIPVPPESPRRRDSQSIAYQPATMYKQEQNKLSESVVYNVIPQAKQGAILLGLTPLNYDIDIADGQSSEPRHAVAHELLQWESSAIRVFVEAKFKLKCPSINPLTKQSIRYTSSK